MVTFVPKPYTGCAKLLLAIDVGTTHSSISYCIHLPHQAPVVLAVTRFPGQGLACHGTKIPSAVYYDRHGSVRAAGAEVLNEDIVEIALREGWEKAEWWKLRLGLRDVDLPKSISTKIPPLPSGKSAMDVLTDFIRYLFECAKTYIQDAHSAFTWASLEDSIEYILTYPGGLDEHKSLYFQAMERAGLVSNTPGGQLRVRFLADGEANLHCYAPQLFNQNTLASQGVVVIDAGGGTINLSMYSATRTSGAIYCEEIAPAECRVQGSLLVSFRAQTLIEGKLEGWEHSGVEDIIRYTRVFDQTTKLVIGSDQRPAYVKIGGRRTHCSSYGILSGQLKLTGEEATGLFNDSLNAVIDAFEQQRKYTDIPITTALIVGGLSENKWVWTQLQSYFTAKNMRIYRPDHHSHKMVATGAVLYATATVALPRPMDIHLIHVCRGPLTKLSNDGDHNSRRTTLRNTMCRVASRVESLVKKCNIWEWLPSTNPFPIYGLEK